MFAEGKKKKYSQKKLNELWKKKREQLAKKHKGKKMKIKGKKGLKNKKGGGFFGDLGHFFSHLPSEIGNAFVTIHDLVTGENSFNEKYKPTLLNTWDKTPAQVNQEMAEYAVKGLKPEKVDYNVIAHNRGIIGGVAKKEKTHNEIVFAEENKTLRDAKRRFDVELNEAMKDYKDEIIAKNNLQKRNYSDEAAYKQDMKKVSQMVADMKKDVQLRTKINIVMASANAYQEGYNYVKQNRGTWEGTRTGMGKPKKKSTKKKNTTKRR